MCSFLMRAAVAERTTVFLFLQFLKTPPTEAVQLSTGGKQHPLPVITSYMNACIVAFMVALQWGLGEGCCCDLPLLAS